MEKPVKCPVCGEDMVEIPCDACCGKGGWDEPGVGSVQCPLCGGTGGSGIRTCPKGCETVKDDV